MTNLRAWEDYPLRPPAPAPLPTVRALERATIPFAALEEERSPKAIFTTLAAVGMISNDTEGVSALAMALLLQGAAGHPDAEHAYDDARGPAAAIAAASHVAASTSDADLGASGAELAASGAGHGHLDLPASHAVLARWAVGSGRG